INFISGFELDLETARRVRLAFRGPIYADLHPLLLAVDPAGHRVPQPLAAWREWRRCFDIAQVNEMELAVLPHTWGGACRLAAEVVGEALRLLLVTLGDRGAAYVASPSFRPQPLSWYGPGLAPQRPLAAPGAVRSERVAQVGGAREGDPTGCGDVWGATCFLGLLAGPWVEEVIAAATAAAARTVEHRGATGLHHCLQGRIAT